MTADNLRTVTDGLATIGDLRRRVRELERALAAGVVFRAWSAPVLGQAGTVAATVTRARVARFGGLLVIRVRLDVTGTGTAGSAVELSGFPVAAVHADAWGGSWSFDDGTTRQAGEVVGQSTSVVRFQANGETDVLGVAPSFAIGSGDVLRATITAEI